jgi:dihydrolipoamide dehydrogenase
MSKLVDVTLPDIGDFKDVEVIEVMVAPGDTLRPEDSMVALESDKATMEVPAPQGGVVREVKVAVGDKVSQGSLLLTLDVTEQPAAAAEPAVEAPPSPAPGSAPATSVEITSETVDLHAEVLVLGAGPGGYTAAFRAADLGKQVVLVERYSSLGGVCLNVGCIPSKALLHIAKVLDETAGMAAHGVRFGAPELDLDKIRAWKDSVVKRLTRGLSGLARQRKVKVVQGVGRFVSPHRLEVENPRGKTLISFDHAIIAAGSRSTEIPGFPHREPRLMDSTAALALEEVPTRMLVIGGGIIGLEMATVYSALGSRISIVELSGGLVPGCDPDLVRPLQKRIQQRYESIRLNTKVTAIEVRDDGLSARMEGRGGETAGETYDRILMAVGRRPNGGLIGAENAGVRVNENGFIDVDRQLRTNVPHIYAIGDLVGQPMLAHKAVHEAKVAAEVIAGRKSSFDARVIPGVAYTDPEIAWAGITETEAKAKGLRYGKGVFPWAASGRSLGMGREEGITKLLFDEDSGRVLGAGIVGPHAGDLIAEAALAIEMGADAADIGLTIHPHPTLSETVGMAAEAFEGSLTDLYIPAKKR